MLKLNPAGSAISYSTYIGGKRSDFAYDIEIDSNRNAFVTGRTNSSNFPTTPGAFNTTHGGSSYNVYDDAFVFKLNSLGSLLVYSTYIGGYSWESGNDIEIDSYGNSYVAGQTDSPDFPITENAYDTTYCGWNWDVFVLKLDPTGSSLIFSTFMGGYGSEEQEGRGRGIAIDSYGDIYVTGETSFQDFPVTEGAYDISYNGGIDDAFIFKLDSSGSFLIYSTFIGGEERDLGYDIEVDPGGNAYVTGFTDSIDFPNTTIIENISNPGWRGIFVLCLNSTGSLLRYSTFIGGGVSYYHHSIEIDLNGNAYVTGNTNWENFPTTQGAFDTTPSSNYPSYNGFMFKLNTHNPPKAIGLNISKSETKRTNPIYLHSNGIDTEDSDQNLIPFFEYRDSKEQIWNATNFSPPQYQNSCWEVKFTPPKSAILGLYDFRVRFNDTDNFFGSWKYLNDSLTILNNKPLIENIILSNLKIFRGEYISILLNGVDIENEEKDMIIDLKYRNQLDKSWDDEHVQYFQYNEDYWECTLPIPLNATVGYYDFKARFQDKDGDYSSWLYKNNSLLVKNNPIIENIPDTDIIMYEDTIKILNLTDWFQDPEGENLVFKIEGQNNIPITQFENGTIMLEPKHNWAGIENLILIVNDSYYEDSFEIRIIVFPVNDPPTKPIIYEPEDGDEFNVTHRISFIGYCEDVDLIYGDELNFTWISNISGVIGFGNELYYLTLPAGYHNISLTVTDLENTYNSSSINIYIFNLTTEVLLEIDSDNDTYNDTYEKLKDTDPFDNTSYPLDTDGDGIYNYLDPDDDNDGYSDSMERAFSTDLLDPNDIPPDLDNDLLPDLIDPDIDDDGVLNEDDDYPYDPEKWGEEEIEYSIIFSILIGMVFIVILSVMFFILLKERKEDKSNGNN